MSSSYFFVEAPVEESAVLHWFRGLEHQPEETVKADNSLFFFRQFGGLEYDEGGKIDPSLSPLIRVFPTKIRRQSLWTVGEVHFFAKGSSPCGKNMAKLQRRFQTWLHSCEQIYGPPLQSDNDFSYYLEGGVTSWTPKIFALPTGLTAIKSGQYFVNRESNDHVLDSVCKTLRLRGVICA